MIQGIGTDIIEVNRMSERLKKEQGFISSIFTPKEIEYCEKFKFKAQNYAARFAAKEAFLKAIGTGWRNGLSFNQIEITNNKLGKPEINVTGKAREIIDEMKIKNIHVSLTHSDEYSVATVIIEN